jgi:hypothetical protein
MQSAIERRRREPLQGPINGARCGLRWRALGLSGCRGIAQGGAAGRSDRRPGEKEGTKQG